MLRSRLVPISLAHAPQGPAAIATPFAQLAQKWLARNAASAALGRPVPAAAAPRSLLGGRRAYADDMDFLKRLKKTSFKDRATAIASSQAAHGDDHHPAAGAAGAGPRGDTFRDFSGLKKPDWGAVDGPVTKNFYKEHPQVAAMSDAEVQKLRDEHAIRVVGQDCPKPCTTFANSGLPQFLVDQLTAHGITEPSPIQKQSIPVVLQGRDMIGRAETGSGKTLAFLLPACVHIAAQPPLMRGDGPIGLVLAPTRELALQIEKEVTKFGMLNPRTHMRSVCVHGGVAKAPQQTKLEKGAHMVIATPGRLLDLLEAGIVNLDRVTYLVMDEADRMLDMGFEDQIRAIVSQLRPDRQTVMWSATWPKAVDELSRDYLKEPTQVLVGATGLAASANITQIVDLITPSEKRPKILALLEEMKNHRKKAIVFVGQKVMADILGEYLRQQGLRAGILHGDKTQSARDSTLSSFRSGALQFLIATDVAARGIDIKDIDCVINYDFPQNCEDYVHRIGRTGRAGAKGTAYSFLTPADYRSVPKLLEILKETNQEVDEELFHISRSLSRQTRMGQYRPAPIHRRYGGGSNRDYANRDGNRSFGNRDSNASNFWEKKFGGNNAEDSSSRKSGFGSSSFTRPWQTQ